MKDEYFIILNVDDMHNWPSWHGGGHVMPGERRPSFIHTSRASAEAEAMRLQGRFRHGRFAIFAAEQVTTLLRVPTHVNIKGEAMNFHNTPTLSRLEDDDVPF